MKSVLIKQTKQSDRRVFKRSNTSRLQQLQHRGMVSDGSAPLAILCYDAPTSLKMMHYSSSQPLILAGQGVGRAVALHDDTRPTIENITVDPAIAVDAPICSANEINELKRDLERERKANEYLQSTKELCKIKCSRLQKVMDDAMIRAELQHVSWHYSALFVISKTS